MNPFELARTSSFRLVVTFLILFSAASIGLFTFVHWKTSNFLTEKTDEWVSREAKSLLRLPKDQLVRRLQVSEANLETRERPFSLFDPSGNRIAGTPLVILPAILTGQGRTDFRAEVDGRSRRFRGLITKIETGDFLIVAQSLSEQQEFDERLFNATVLAAVATAALGLLGAIYLGAGAVRQIDDISRATERIVKGDLTQRLPLGRGGGDIDRLTRVVNRMLDDIERLMSEVKGVCDNIAHDMRTPLTRLLAGLERGRRRATSVAEYEACVDEAVEEVHGILKTFGALLRISEVEDGIRRSGFTEVDLAVVARDAAELFEPAAEERGITLTYSGSPAGVALMSGDADLLFEAISNLIDNAVKFSRPGGAVGISVIKDAVGISLWVDDRGPGIPEDEAEAVLRRFYRTERSRTTPGNGLGLSLVAAIVRLHDLNLSITNTSVGCRVAMSTERSRPLPRNPEKEAPVRTPPDAGQRT